MRKISTLAVMLALLAAPVLVAAQDQQHLEFGAVEVGKMIEDCQRNP